MRITLGQFNPILGEKEKNLAEVTRMLKQASEEDSDLVILPELCLSGYFIQDVSHQMAEPMNGKSIRSIQKLCKALNIYTLFPWAELGDDGNVYNSACLISNQGEIVGNYRKVHLYDTEKEVFTPGNEFRVFNTNLGKIGVMICFDLDFPESARVLSMKGADIILIPTNNFKPYESYQDTYLRSRSMENELPVAICNRTGKERKLEYFGRSSVYDAFGNQIVTFGEEDKVQTVNVSLQHARDKNLQYKKNREPEAYRELVK